MSERIVQNPTPDEMARMVGFAKIASPMLQLLGVQGEAIDALADISEMADVLELPDRFNDAFLARGWIACESFSLEVMRTALDLHAIGKDEEADLVIADMFDVYALERLRLRSERYHRSPARDAQLAEAAQLYVEKRYLAALPLILIAADGVSYDFGGFGVFTDAADLTSFDTIVGHATGLPALLASVRAPRGRTNDDPLMFPYRNGILHGRDLGYGDRITCAKAWMIYQALIDWAASKESEEARKEEEAQRQCETLSDSLTRYEKTQETRQQLDSWKARDPSWLPAEPFEKGSPEEALFEYMTGWRDRNFMKMGRYAPNFVKKTPGKMAHEIRWMAGRSLLSDFRVIAFADTAPAMASATLELTFATADGPLTLTDHTTLGLDPGNGAFDLRGPNTKWYVQGGMLNRAREAFGNI